MKKFTLKQILSLLHSNNQTISKNGFIKDATTNKFIRNIYGNKIQVNNIIGFLGEFYITELSQVKVISEKLIFKS